LIVTIQDLSSGKGLILKDLTEDTRFKSIPLRLSRDWTLVYRF